MLGQIDKSLKPLFSRLYLCKPNRETIAELTEASKKTIKYSKNGIHELTFRVPYLIEKNHEFIKNDHVDLLRGHFLIKYEKGNETHFFIINNPKNTSENGVKFKEVKCFLLPYQLNKKIIRDYSETKKLYSDVGSDGVLNQTLLTKTDWSVGYIDTDIATKYRTFDISEKSLLEFITSDIVDAYDCIVLWDTVNKTVSFYKQNNIGTDRGLSIENGKYLKSITEEPDFENVVTRMYGYGKDGLTIQRLNPSGTEYIDDLTYYMYPFERDSNGNVLKHSIYMSDSLCNAILDYNALLETKQGEFATHLSDKEAKQEQLSTKETELFNLQTDLAIINDRLDIANSNNDDTSQIITDKTNKENEISIKKNEIASVESEIATIDNQIEIIKAEIAIENNFTHEQIIERDNYIYEKTFNNNHYDNDKDLYDQLKLELNKAKQPLIDYSIDIVDFLKVVECQRDWDKLKQFDIVTVRYPDFGVDIKAKIIEIIHNEDDNSISLEIANSNDINNGFLSLKDLLNQAASSSTTVDMSKFKWNKSVSNESEINKIINNAWDATKNAIEGGVNNTVDISRRGIIIKDPNDPLRYLVAQNGVLALTNDGGNTWKHSITPDGIVAERLLGKLILSNNMVIGDENGIIDIVGNLITIKDNNEILRVSLGEYATGKYGLQLKSKDGNTTVLDEDGILQTDTIQEADNVDANNPLKLKFYIDDSTLRIDKIKLNFSLEAFRAYSRGTSSGGGATRTTSSGGSTTVTSESGGGDTQTSSTENVRSGTSGHNHGIYDGTKLQIYNSTSYVTFVESGNHDHSVSIPSHSHNVSIPSHDHSVYVPSHTHGISYGIYTSTSATGVNIIVDGTIVDSTGYTTDRSDIDLTQYITTTGWHTIELTSTSLGRINASLYMKSFIGI